MKWITILFASGQQVTIRTSSIAVDLSLNQPIIENLEVFDEDEDLVGVFCGVQAYWYVPEPEQPGTKLRVN